jgi:protein-S-isoprenylcysteine O-methyltransferase Ste14
VFSRILRLPPVLCLLVIAGASLMQARFPRALGIPSFAVGMAAGIVIWSVAAGMTYAALRRMKKHGTTVEPGQQPTSLVMDGVFRVTRNPLYLSLLLFVAGLAVATDVMWFAPGVLVLWLLLDRLVVTAEERMLEATFGEEYMAYKRRTRRWL